jgi:3-hydroxyacyl-CoA dehydrogenase
MGSPFAAVAAPAGRVGARAVWSTLRIRTAQPGRYTQGVDTLSQDAVGDYRPIRRVTVLGAGTMGARVAAHLVNAQFDVTLLDVREDLAAASVKALAGVRPDPLFLPGWADRIQTGAFDHPSALGEADWIIEAIVEAPEPKRRLLEAVDARRTPGSFVSTNTSGLSVAALADGRSDDFRRHWVGTHFFNPPRYMHLVELVPTADTEPGVVGALRALLDRRLGKGVVVARDTPAFIANRLGTHGAMQFLAVAASGAFTIEEIDAVTGPLIGRPKSATFRTIDLAGLDVLAAVASDLATRLPDPSDRRGFDLPPFVGEMVRRGLLGEKAGQGFYKRVRSATGESAILTLDLATFEYREAKPPALPEIDDARRIVDLDERLRHLFKSPHRVGDLLRRTLGATLLYAARVAPEIAHSIDDVDRAMQWGFGWARGPFETWDAIGHSTLFEAGLSIVSGVPGVPGAAPMTGPGAGRARWREDALASATPGLLLLQEAKSRTPVVARNAGASLIDLGDDVLAVEFHSKMNAIGADTITMLRTGVDRASRDFSALVIGHEQDPFSAGANLALLLMEAQEGNWDEIDAMVRGFQATTMAIKYAPVPVIVAPAGLALGGGCEICLHADRVQAAAETYVGLVEVGVGLIPAGGGTKELILRANARAAGGDAQPFLRQAFETIGFARVSTSAADARRLGYLRDVDGITMNRDRLIADAKARALARVAEGYAASPPQPAVTVGGADVLAMLLLGVHLAHRAGRLSDHDATIGRALARVIAGGSTADVPHRTTVSEGYLLDLEREAFLSLCGERRTLERIAHTLKTGKSLRN